MSKNGFKDDKKNQLIENKQIDQNEQIDENKQINENGVFLWIAIKGIEFRVFWIERINNLNS